MAFLSALGGRLPPHFDIERFGIEADRWAAQGLQTRQIAQASADQQKPVIWFCQLKESCVKIHTNR